MAGSVAQGGGNVGAPPPSSELGVRGHTTAVAAAATEDFVIAYPSDLALNDLLLVILADDDTGEDANFAAPAGWVTRYAFGANDTTLTIMTKTATGSETGNLTIEKVGSDERSKTGIFIALQGADVTGNPIKVAGAQVNSTSATIAVTGATSTKKAIAIAAMSFDGGDALPISVSGTGWSLLDSVNESANSGSVGSSLAVATKSLASALASGTCTFTPSVTDGKTGIQIIFEEA